MTLMEKATSMLSGATLGHELWVEVVDTACYLFNRSLSSSLEDKTPHKVWTGNKPGESQYCSNNATTLGTPFFNFINPVVHNKLGSDGAVCTSTSPCRSCHLVSWHKCVRA